MKIEAYTPTSFDEHKDFLELLRNLYDSNKNFEFFLEEYRIAYNFCCTSKYISFFPTSFYNGEKLVAHVALIVDSRLKEGEAFFGFFELLDDEEIFDTIWGKLIELAKVHNIHTLKGPVNGSIWHQYRCVSESNTEQFFATEPMTPLYYYRYLSTLNSTKKVTYSSGVRDSYAGILSLLKSQKEFILQKLEQGNFRIDVENEISHKQLASIASLSASVFDQKSWGYTQLDASEFMNLYSPGKINEHIYKLFTLYQNDTLIGYCSTIRDGDTLICKTICITQEFQGKGLGNALALYVHEEAERDGITKVMYVLVKDGNQVHNYPTDDVRVFRRYAAFEYDITA